MRLDFNIIEGVKRCVGDKLTVSDKIWIMSDYTTVPTVLPAVLPAVILLRIHCRTISKKTFILPNANLQADALIDGISAANPGVMAARLLAEDNLHHEFLIIRLTVRFNV